HFPDTDANFKDADSLELLKKVVELIKLKGYSVNNIDATIIAQSPKLAPFIDKMRENIAIALGVSIDCVSVKATTEEKLGFTGAKEGISAHCVCLVESKKIKFI
ncbi:MAG: 2-C-methyl-D-erythritol 2,4-cyclodiphosphate synthase, partial [Clostridia bacterium]|nr:2-C-methyl-D-erythritol 2,4-cyclodiphosphate synthase [Clostridia bacterium]